MALVTIVIYGQTEPRTRQLAVAATATVATALNAVGETADDRIILLNGLHAGPADPVRDGDRLCVFSPIAGGGTLN